MKRLILSAALAIAASAAWAEPPSPAGPGGPPGPHAPPARMFLSPSGEPFRPAPGGPEGFSAWFDRADANHDDKIDRAEFRADAMAFFKTLDVNGDGRIDGFELSAYEHKIVPELIAEVETRAFGPPRPSGGARRNGPYGRERPRPEGGGEEGGGDASGRGHLALLRDPEPVSSADTDVDGRVSAAEWLAAADARFDLLDGKGADALTREAMANLLPKPGKPGKRR
jgi:hypothetical protein